MSARTTLTTGWKIRLGGMAILFTGMGCWFLYDGLVGYPSQQAIADEFDAFRLTNEKDNPKWQDAWDAEAEKKGYPAVVWREPEDKWYEDLRHDSSSIMWQLAFGGVALPFAAWFIFLWVKSGKRWIEADDDGVHNESGRRATWDQMVKLDKRRWPKKGIAVLHYADSAEAATKAREALSKDAGEAGDTGGAVTKTITLDDWKYEQASTKAIVMAIESHLGDDLIIGDITEAKRDAEKKAKAEAEAENDAAGEGDEQAAASTETDADETPGETHDKSGDESKDAPAERVG